MRCSMSMIRGKVFSGVRRAMGCRLSMRARRSIRAVRGRSRLTKRLFRFLAIAQCIRVGLAAV
jgi:hypothetical protein